MPRMLTTALMTTGIVLITIFVLNQIPFTRPMVQRAIVG